MQGRFLRTFVFFILFTCSFFHLFSVDNIIKRNAFFEKVDFLILQLQVLDTQAFNEMDEEEKNKRANKFDLIKQLANFSRKIPKYKFSCNRMSISDLAQHLRSIDKFEAKLLNGVKVLFNSKEIDWIKKIFDSLRMGICFSLSKDHLIILRIKLFSFLEQSLNLIDSWKNQFNKFSLERKIENCFSSATWQDHVKNKIRNLSFLKDRLASYLGKIDDLFFKFLMSDFEIEDKQKFEELNDFIINGIYCVNSFLLKTFDPDLLSYEQGVKTFRSYSLKEIISVVCNNHSNVLLTEYGFEAQIRNFQTPGFLRRNWFTLSALGIVSSVGGVYVYNNWYELTGDAPSSLKMRMQGFYEDGKKGVVDSYTHLKQTIKSNFWPDKSDSESSESKLKKLREIVNNDLQNDFNSLRKYSQIDEEEFVKLNTEEQEFLRKLKNIFTEWPETLNDPTVLFNAINKIQNEILSPIQKQIQQNCDNFNRSTPIFQKFNRLLTQTFNSEHAPEEHSDLIEKVGDKLGNVGGSLLKLFAHRKKETFDLVFNEIGIAFDKYKKARENGALDGTWNNLLEMINSIIDVVRFSTSHIPSLGILSKIYKIISYKIVADVLEEADKSATTIEVTLNWIRAITTILIPSTIIFFGVKKILKNKRIQKNYEINSIILNIWEIFNRHNLIEADYYHGDLEYKDRGEINFWLELLERKIDKVSLKDRRQFLDLIFELKRRDVSLHQKIEIIKIKWGSNLVNNPLVV